MLGLTDAIQACLFDMDGVLTNTATLHAAAWKEMFDRYLRQRAERSGTPLVPFDLGADYRSFVDGRPRADGARSFLASRGIHLPEGSSADPPEAETVHALGERKNVLIEQHIREDGVQVYAGSLRYLAAARDAGLRLAVVTSSANAAEVLDAAGIAGLFETCIDGNEIVRDGLTGKPAPDTFLAAARKLGVPPERAAIFEDALAGVEAGRAGGFAEVVGVDRNGQAAELRRHGATVVVTDLAELLGDIGHPEP